jgi:hypothetical protein
MSALKQFGAILVGAVIGGALLVNAGTASAQTDKCQKGIEKAAAKYEATVAKTLAKCADTVRKNKVKGKSQAGSGKACEKGLAKIYNIDADPAITGKSAADKFRAAVDALVTGLVCTDQDLVQLSHQVSGGGSYASAPGASVQQFVEDYELMAMETAAIQQEIASNTSFFGLVYLAVNATDSKGGTKGDATQCGRCSLETSECTGGTHKACTTDADCVAAVDPSTDPASGTARNNLCSFAPQCLFRTCTAGGATAAYLKSGSLGGFEIPLGLSGQNVLGICQVATSAVEGYGQGAGANLGIDPDALYVVGSNNGSLKPVTIPATATVCVNTIGAEGWCDCGLASHPTINVSYCQDRLATGKHPDACGNDPAAGGFPTNPDADFPGTEVGFAIPTFSGTAASGDCLVLDTTQFKILTDGAGEEGADGTPCTADDEIAPSAAVTIPLTTGTAQATMHDAVLGTATQYGGCDGDSTAECIDVGGCSGCNITCGYAIASTCPDGTTACTTDADCASAVAGICRADSATTCKKDGDCAGHVAATPCILDGAVSTGDMVSTLQTGAPLSCTSIAGGQLTGLKLAGAFPSGGGTKGTLGDTITSFILECGS